MLLEEFGEERGGLLVGFGKEGGFGFALLELASGWLLCCTVFTFMFMRLEVRSKSTGFGFESSCNFLYESGVEVEGVAGLQVAGVNSLSLG